jgi:hypothetical protein
VDDLDRLLSLEDIRQLAQRYALAVDGKDVDGMAALFVPHVDNGRWGAGRKGVKAFYAQSLRKFHCSVHFVANHVIDLGVDGDDDRATGVVYCQARHHVLEPEDHWFDEALAYFDAYERVDGGWLFRRRRLRSWYRQTTTDRVVPEVLADGPKRGGRMPEAFPTFESFWA